MKRKLQNWFLSFVLVLPVIVFGQPGAISTNNLTGAGAYDCRALTDYGNFRQARILAGATTTSGTVTWEFPATCAFPGDVWRPYTAGTTAVPLNTVMDPAVSTNSARYNAGNGGSSGTLGATTSGRYYTFNVQEAASGSNAFMAVLQTTYNPVAISGVSVVGNSATINITLAATLNTGEYLYIRWHTGAGFGSATITAVTTLLSGNTYTVNLPGLTNGQTVTYYVFTSNQSSGLTNANADYFTLNILNNGTANYSYIYGSTTYYWVGGAAAALTTSTTTVLSTTLGGAAANVTLTILDKIIFDGNDISSAIGSQTGAVTVSNTAASLSFGQLVLQSNANVTYSPSSTFDISLNGGTGIDLSVAGATTFSFGTSNPKVILLTGTTGSVSGTFNIGSAGAGTHQLVGTDAGAITFQSGSVCNVNGSASDLPFGSGTSGSVIFAPGSVLKHTKSDDIFGGSAKTVVTFQTGSTYEYIGINGSYFNFRLGGSPAKTYADVIINCNGTFNTGSYSNNPTVDNLTVAATAVTDVTGFNLQDAGHTLTIKGSLINNNTSFLNFTPNVNGTATVNFTGSATQYIINKTGSPAGINFFTNNSSRIVLVNINAGAAVKLGNGTDGGNITLTSFSGTPATAVFTVKNGGTLDMLTSVIYGAATSTGGTFTIESGGTVKTGYLSGLSATAATGAVQTQIKRYNSGANYVFNGITGAQITGNFFAFTTITANTVNNLTIDNTSGVVLDTMATVNVNGILYLTNGIFNTITKNALVVIPMGAGVSRTNGWVYGNLQKYVNGSTNFEVGDNLYYANVSVSGTITTPGLFTVKTNANGNHPNYSTSSLNQNKSENTYWTLTNNTVTFSGGAGLVFNYQNADIDAGATPANFKLGNYNASVWSYPVSISPAANSMTVTGVTQFGDFWAAESSCGTFGYWLGTTNTDWNTASNWCGGVPTPTTDVVIQNVPNKPVISVADAFAKTIVIDAGASLTMSGIYNLTLSGSTFTNNAGALGFDGSASTGAIIFTAATAAVSGTTTFQNVTISNCGLDFGTASTVNGTFKINAGGYVDNNHPPVYACTSTLLYNTGGNYNRGSEWKSGVSTGQAGYPGNVQLSTNSTDLKFGNTAAALCGNLTIDLNTTFDMGNFTNNALTIGGNFIANGTFYLSLGSGGDVYVGGNYTVGTSGTVWNNLQKTFFDGASGTQTITKTGGGTVYFDYMIVNKASGDVKINNTAGDLTNMQINSSNNNASEYVLQLQSGDIDLNGRSFILNGTVVNSTNIYTSGTGVRRIYTSTGTGNFNVIGTASAGAQNLNVNRASASSSLTFDANVTLATSVGVDFGPSGMTLINSIFQLNSNGFCINNSPVYGSSSFLVYNNGGGGFNRNVEWNSNVAGAGYPNNIIIQNNTPLVLDAFAFSAAGLGCSGYADIKSGSSITMGALAKNLSVGTDLTISGTLTLSTTAGGDLFVGGSWTRTGTFTQNSRNVTFNGSINGTITATGGQQFSNVYISKSAKTNTITLVDSISVTREIGFTQGTYELASKNTTIISTASYTARVAESDAANTVLSYSGTGRFIIERNVQALRSWRLLTAPINTSQAIRSAWMEGAAPSTTSPLFNSNPVSGYGMHISGPSPLTNGFDETPQNNYSIKYYDPTLAPSPNWTGAGATPVIPGTTDITSKAGWMVFIRGDRSYPISTTQIYTTPQTTTLRTTGKINIGNMPMINPSGFTVVGNPYASAVNFSSVFQSGALDAYYVWDPKINSGTSGTAVGGWVMMTRGSGTSYTAIPTPASSAIDLTTGRIESGEAIVVNSANVSSLQFKEADKTALNSLVFRPVGNNNSVVAASWLRTNLYGKNSDGSTVILDGVMNMFDKSYNNEVDGGDGIKFTNIAENFSLIKGDIKLTLDKRNELSENDTIFYDFSQVKVRDYVIELDAKRMTKNNLVGYLEDKFLGIRTRMNSDGITKVEFNANREQQGSYAKDRFRIVFKKAVKYNFIKADILNCDVLVSWKVADELEIGHYEVERSLDGKNFSSIATIVSKKKSENGYSELDEKPSPGEYWYRIKTVTGFGMEVYSEAVKVKVVRASDKLYVFPNPVTDNIIQVQFTDVPAGKYNTRLVSANGQLIFSKLIIHAGGIATKVITPAQKLINGIYQLEIISPNGQKSLIKVMAVSK